MKIIPLLFLLFFSISCSQTQLNNNPGNTSSTDSINNEFGERLVKANFLQYADSAALDSLRYQLVHAFDMVDERIYKLAHIDAEELAEFNFGFFIPGLNIILEKRNFKLSLTLAENYEKSHSIYINGVKLELYTEAELRDETFLVTGPGNFFKKVNELLFHEGLSEKFYLLYQGNDLHAILLTLDQFKIIEERYKADQNEIPYLP